MSSGVEWSGVDASEATEGEDGAMVKVRYLCTLLA